MHSEKENYSHKIKDPGIFTTYMQGLGISVDPEWKLLRLEDGLIKKSSAIMWLEWGDNDRVKSTVSYTHLTLPTKA